MEVPPSFILTFPILRPLRLSLSNLTNGTLRLSNLCRDIYRRLQKTDIGLFATSPPIKREI